MDFGTDRRQRLSNPDASARRKPRARLHLLGKKPAAEAKTASCNCIEIARTTPRRAAADNIRANDAPGEQDTPANQRIASTAHCKRCIAARTPSTRDDAARRIALLLGACSVAQETATKEPRKVEFEAVVNEEGGRAAFSWTEGEDVTEKATAYCKENTKEELWERCISAVKQQVAASLMEAELPAPRFGGPGRGRQDRDVLPC